MKKTLLFNLVGVLLVIGCYSCASDDNYTPIQEPEQVSPVNFDIDLVPYQRLSEYNFYEGALADLQPVFGVTPYDLISPLFSDYAHKKRFIWLPDGETAAYVNDYSSFEFPTGTILIKNFYYDNVLPENTTKLIETRLMIKKDTEWEFAKYVWNDSQTEATLDQDGSFVEIDWINGGSQQSVNYRIPSQAECFTCHNKFGTPVPIGPKPQNINRNYAFEDGSQNQLDKWVELGILESYPSAIETTVDWSDPAQPLDLRARSYIDINCAHCHSEESYCEYRPMRFGFNESATIENMGICIEPDTNIDDNLTHIIAPNSPEESVVFYRISSIEEQFRMPLLGRTLQHREGVQLIEEYINSLINPCD